MKNANQSNYTNRNFLPLIVIFMTILLLTFIRQYLNCYNFDKAMKDFMGFFFLIFGGFKILNLQKFSEAYQTYDLIAQRSKLYAYAYPFIEIFLAFLYLSDSSAVDVGRIWLLYANIITLVLMSISAIGVFRALLQKRSFECACLGLVFKIPMTYVTLLEDVIMGAMALYMILK